MLVMLGSFKHCTPVTGTNCIVSVAPQPTHISCSGSNTTTPTAKASVMRRDTSASMLRTWTWVWTLSVTLGTRDPALTESGTQSTGKTVSGAHFCQVLVVMSIACELLGINCCILLHRPKDGFTAYIESSKLSGKFKHDIDQLSPKLLYFTHLFIALYILENF
jgi:hypothetical protein